MTHVDQVTPAVSHRRIRDQRDQHAHRRGGYGPLVVLLHGFPECGTRGAINCPALAAAGYHAVAPDLRGVGETEASEAVESYSLRNQIADILGLLDALARSGRCSSGTIRARASRGQATEVTPHRVAAHATLGIAAMRRALRARPPVQTIREFTRGTFTFAIYFQSRRRRGRIRGGCRRTMLLFMYGISGDAPPDLVPYLFTGSRTPPAPLTACRSPRAAGLAHGGGPRRLHRGVRARAGFGAR